MHSRDEILSHKTQTQMTFHGIFNILVAGHRVPRRLNSPKYKYRLPAISKRIIKGSQDPPGIIMNRDRLNKNSFPFTGDLTGIETACFDIERQRALAIKREETS